MAIEREFLFTDQDFKVLGELVTQHAGIIVTPEKFDMFYSRLGRRLRALGLSTFKEYCDLLIANERDEFPSFINAITTNLTSFFRENHHFDYLSSILPKLLKTNAASRRIRIWSAGCSTGEEPYSLAMTVKQCIPQNLDWDIKILATDIDSNVLAAAAQGNYKIDRITGISNAQKSKWFKKGVGANDGIVAVNQELKDLIGFKRLNLMDARWPMKGPFDVIFCRNVVIYFDKTTKEKLVERYTNLLVDRGHLFVGHSESLHRISTKLKLIGNTIYQKS